MIIIIICETLLTTYSYSSSNNYTGMLPPGKYKIDCYGAQGGYQNAKYPGGNGAYFTADIVIKGYKSYNVIVGQTGTSNLGGYPDGGNPSDTYYNPAGGGGSSRFYLDDELIIVAGAGSGGYDGLYSDSSGAPAGCIDYNYNMTDQSDKPVQNFYLSNLKKFQCIDADGYYSGGGGGYYGGMGGYAVKSLWDIEYRFFGSSGTSFVQENVVDSYSCTDDISSSYTGDGTVSISYYYQCSSNCYNCSSAEICTECNSGYVLDNGKCYLPRTPSPSPSIAMTPVKTPDPTPNITPQETPIRTPQPTSTKKRKTVSFQRFLEIRLKFRQNKR